jgi:predicted transcriptional regulator
MKLLNVGDAITKGFESCQTDCTIVEAAEKMVIKVTHTVVVENKIGKPLGLITGGDIVKSIAKKLTPKTKIEEIVSKELITVDAGEDIIDAATLMNDKNIKRLGVMEKGELIGILTANDVLKYSPKILHEFTNTLEKLDSIIKRL